MAQDEVLSSFLLRAAHAHGVPLRSLLKRLAPAYASKWSDFDVSAPEAFVADVAQNFGLSRERVVSATLRNFRDLMQCHRRGRCETTFLLPVSRMWRRSPRPCVQVCPVCIGSREPYFRKAWRAAFYVTCEIHNVAMVDCCTHCEADIRPQRAVVGAADRCWRCGRVLWEGAQAVVERRATKLQRRLTSLFRRGCLGSPRPSDRDCATGIRVLIGLAAAPCRASALRHAFEVPPESAIRGNSHFEWAMSLRRSLVMDVVDRWVSQWPDSFRYGASAAHLTQTTLRGRDLPEWLNDEVGRLPPGVTRSRRRLHIVGARAQKLRLLDPFRYREMRAAHLWSRVERTP
jgi:hypothetical protein